MDFRALKTWQWMLVALLIGLGVGLLRNRNQSEIHGIYIDGFGYFLGDQQRFEDALITEVEGQRRFHDITVYPREIEDAHGENKRVYLVKGTYYGSPPQTVERRSQGGWQLTCFIAPVPYDPLIDFSTLEKPGSPDWSKTFRAAGLQPTVLDFLSILHSAAGVNYRYAWWDSHPVIISTLISFILIGLVWPASINLLSFKRFTRPPEAKKLSLWKVSNRNVLHPVVDNPIVSDISNSAEPQISGPVELVSGSSDEPRDACALPPADPTRPAIVPHQDSREFGLREEDFYPTERRAPADDE